MFNRYRKSLEYCFSLLRKVAINSENEKATAYLLQETILKRIVECEARIRKANKERDILKASLGNKDVMLTKEEARKAKSRITQHELFTEGHHILLRLYHDIGDGIAFTYVNAFDIKPLAFKQPPGFISGKKGTRLERKVLRSAKTMVPEDGFLILNDLTNCLRYGDVTLAVGGRIATIIELKSGKRKKRTDRDSRQVENLKKMADYLHTDKTDALYGHTGEFTRMEAHANPVRNDVALNELIEKSKVEKIVVAFPEKELAYVVIRDTTKLDDTLSFMKKTNDQWVMASVNEAKFNNTGYYPFTLSIHDPANLLAFYNGEYLISVFLNVTQLQRDLKKKNFEFTTIEMPTSDAEIYNGSMYPIQLASTKHKGLMVALSYHFVGRLFYEFLPYKWFEKKTVAYADSIVEQAKEKGIAKADEGK